MTVAVTVVPERFTLVDYDPVELEALTARLAGEIGVTVPVRLEVDETTPLGRAEITSLDPLTLWVESGALEDAKVPRKLSVPGAASVVGLLLLMASDLLDEAFGGPACTAEVPIGVRTAWEVYAAGRLVRLGHSFHDDRQRRLYHLRTRLGFSDAVDAAFERLWSSPELRWDDLEAVAGLRVRA